MVSRTIFDDRENFVWSGKKKKRLDLTNIEKNPTSREKNLDGMFL